jgi:NADPH2:quinone reductase
MKAILVHDTGPPEVMRLEEVQAPEPGPGQVLVKVHAAGVNPVDCYIRSGLYPLKPPLPYSPGMDAAGVVESAGEGVTRIKAGDRVYTAGTLSGAYAEKTLCSESRVFPLPQRLSFAQGAALGVPYSTAYRALFHRAKALPGESVLVHGASGGVGIAAVQLARAAGMQVIGTGGTEEGRRLVTEQGAHQTFDHHAAGYREQILKATGGRGVDVVLEMIANLNLGNDLALLARKGRVVIIGNRGTVEINPRDIMSRDAAVLGMTILNAPEADILSIHAALGAGIENGTLRPVIGKEMALADAVRAHHEIMESRAYGKIVLVP